MGQTIKNSALIKHIISLLFFGFNGVLVSNITIKSYDIVFFRTLIGSILLITLFLINGGRFNIKSNRKDYTYIFLSGIAMGLSWMLLYEGFKQIGVCLSTLLYYCGPVIVMLISPVLFKEKLTLPKIIGFLTVFAGVFLVNGIADGIKIKTWGIVCAFLSAVTYSLMIIFNKLSKKVSGIENTAIQLISSFITVSVFIGIKQHFIFNVPNNEWIWILLLGLINTGYACYLFFTSLSYLPVQTVAVCGYIEPLSAVIFAALILGEKMTLFQYLGAVFIIGGAMFAELFKTKKKRTE